VCSSDLHVVDLAIGHVKAINYIFTNPGLDVINLGTGTGYSVLDMVKAFSKACGKEIPYEIKPRRAGDIDMCYADPSKALKVLGWKAERGLDEMCEDTWRWQSQNPNGYREAENCRKKTTKDSILNKNAVFSFVGNGGIIKRRYEPEDEKMSEKQYGKVRLTGQLKLYMELPAVMAFLLAALDIWIYRMDRRAGFLMLFFVLIYIFMVGYLYIYSKSIVM